MKRTGIIIALCFGLLATQSVKAQYYKTALGVRLSSTGATVNNSISLKYFFSEKTAVEALLSFGDPVAVGALIEKHTAFGPQGLTWLYGAGAYLGFGGTRNVGAQGIIGLDYKISSIPLNLCLDWKPELNLAKEFSFEPSALGVSARFTFN
jgi:hypothetical protein